MKTPETSKGVARPKKLRTKVRSKRMKAEHAKYDAFTTILCRKRDEFGQGFQVMLANKIDTYPSYISEVVNGKRAGSEHLRRAIASALGESYEKMIAWGTWILEGKNPDEFTWAPEESEAENIRRKLDELQAGYNKLEKKLNEILATRKKK
jgi:hypothetical protein